MGIELYLRVRLPLVGFEAERKATKHVDGVYLLGSVATASNAQFPGFGVGAARARESVQDPALVDEHARTGGEEEQNSDGFDRDTT